MAKYKSSAKHLSQLTMTVYCSIYALLWLNDLLHFKVKQNLVMMIISGG